MHIQKELFFCADHMTSQYEITTKYLYFYFILNHFRYPLTTNRVSMLQPQLVNSHNFSGIPKY